MTPFNTLHPIINVHFHSNYGSILYRFWRIGFQTRKPSCHWQNRATRKHAKNCSNSACLQRCRWQYWSIFIRLAVVVFEICEILRNSLKIQTYRFQDYPRSSILVSSESAYATSYYPLIVTLDISHSFPDIDTYSYKIACFPHPTIVWRRLAKKHLALSIQSIHRWKVHLVGYNSVVNITGLIFIHLAIDAFQNREITQNSNKIWPYSSSRSTKVIDLGVNRKLTWLPISH